MIGELIEARLRGSGYPALRNISCHSDSGTLTLRGCLPTYYLKQVALATVTGLPEVQRIVDRIEVQAPTAGQRRS